MKTQELLQELLHRSGHNAANLSTKLYEKGVRQSLLSRFLSGNTKEPRRSTLSPIADYYGISVDAFFDEALAAKILEQISSGELVVQRHKPGRRANPVTGKPAQRPLRNPMQLADAIDLLAERINEIEEADMRELIAARLRTLARAPDSAKARSGVLEALAWANAAKEAFQESNTDEQSDAAPVAGIAGQVLAKKLTTESKDFQPGRTKV